MITSCHDDVFQIIKNQNLINVSLYIVGLIPPLLLFGAVVISLFIVFILFLFSWVLIFIIFIIITISVLLAFIMNVINRMSIWCFFMRLTCEFVMTKSWFSVYEIYFLKILTIMHQFNLMTTTLNLIYRRALILFITPFIEIHSTLETCYFLTIFLLNFSLEAFKEEFLASFFLLSSGYFCDDLQSDTYHYLNILYISLN